jgi:iron complex outermembrane receptor protein
MRSSILVALLSLALVGLSVAEETSAAVRRPTNIPAQDLGSALQTLARERGFQIVYASEDTNGRSTAGAVGEFTTEEALGRLLRGTGLTYRYLDDKTVTIHRVASAAPTQGGAQSSAPPGPAEPDAAKPNTPTANRHLPRTDAGLRGTDATGSSSDNSAAEASPDEIVVTANRRPERLQTVATSITAVTSETLANSGFQNFGDLQYLAPSLTLNPAAVGGFQIRGVGSQAVDPGLEKAVSTVVDDVVQGVPRDPGFYTFADIERVEVLRGPQGTLFGKNASAGVVSIITRRPSLGKTEILGHYRYGTGNEVHVDNTLNAPLGDDVAMRLTGVFQGRDGWLHNVLTGGKSDGYQDYGVRAKLLWRPADAFDVYLTGEVQKHRDGGENVIYTIRQNAPFTGAPNIQDLGAILAAYNIRPSPDNESYAVNATPFNVADSRGLTGTLTYATGNTTLTSVTAYKRVTSGGGIDTDQSPVDFNDLQQVYIQGRQLTQELRLSSSFATWLDSVTGLYFYDLRTHSQERLGGRFNRDVPANTLYNTTGGVNDYDLLSRSYAAFGQGNAHFTSTLTGTIGLRYTHDYVRSGFFLTRDAQYNLLPLSSVAPGGYQSADANNLSGRVSLQYQPTGRLMFYGLVARGYKGPAVGTSGGIVSPVGPETVMNYEIGTKAELFNRALTVNVSAFTQKFKNFQATTISFLPSGVYAFRLANAKGMRSDGAEAELRLRVMSGLSLNASVAYVPSKFTDFQGGCYAGQPLLPAPGRGCYVLPGSTLRVYDISGQPTPFAPWTTGNAGLDFLHALSPRLMLFSNAEYSFRTSFVSTAGNAATTVSGYGLLNGNIGVGPGDGRWRIGLFTRNLLDKKFPARILTIGNAPAGLLAQQTAADARRAVGLSVDFNL